VPAACQTIGGHLPHPRHSPSLIRPERNVKGGVLSPGSSRTTEYNVGASKCLTVRNEKVGHQSSSVVRPISTGPVVRQFLRCLTPGSLSVWHKISALFSYAFVGLVSTYDSSMMPTLYNDHLHVSGICSEGKRAERAMIHH
jgi:hypothetical protein